MSVLQHQFDRLLAWMQETRDIPSWECIRILDTSRPDVRWKPKRGGWQVPAQALLPSEDYEQHFQELLQAGYSWINLSLYGLYGTTLIVGVELPAEASNGPPGKTSINFSGPPMRNEEVDWHPSLVVVDS